MIAELQSAAPEPVQVADVSYARGELPVLHDITLALGEGRRLAVIGPSGCGKSTLLSLIAGLLEPEAGTITVGGDSGPAERLARCALMPQRDLLLPWRSALDNAALALENAGVRRSDARRQAAPLFERFGLAEFESTAPSRLSGGMRQRVAFLRTLLAGKPVLLLDEPFGALDAITRLELQDWLLEALEAEPRTVVLVTHDVDEALKLCPRVVALSRRPARVVLDAASDDVTAEDVLGALRS
jgi:ABC-type nitrate/sulfonate/bicarbonate transport system ATPase subunit